VKSDLDQNAARIAGLYREIGIPADYALKRGLALQPEVNAIDLVMIAQNENGRAVRMIPTTAAGWRQMHLAASAVGVTWKPLSSFSSVIARLNSSAQKSPPDSTSRLFSAVSPRRVTVSITPGVP
jgi:hypothetical protein